MHSKRVAGRFVHVGRSGLLALMLGWPVLLPAASAVSLSLHDADLRVLLQQLATTSGISLVLSDGVQGRISIELSGRRGLDSLDAVLAARGLVREEAAGVHWVATLEEVTARDRRERDWQQAREARQPVQTVLHALHSARAEDIARLLGAVSTGERLLGPRGRVEVDARTNTLVLTDTAERLQRCRDWLAVLDRPARQVIIETRLAAVSRGQALSLGARWRLARPGLLGQVPLAAAGAEVSTLSYGLLGIDREVLDVELSALASEGHGEIIATPSLMTAEQQRARIASGQQIPYQETTQSGAGTTRFVNAELSLEVVPAIAPDGGIALDLVLSHDSPGEIQPSGARAIDTNRLSTRVRMQDGQTLMLGGIFRSQDAHSVSRVPVLGNIPLLGQLFRRRVERRDRQELLVFVTPRLVAEPEPPERRAAEMAADGASDS